ncbi:MAG TPA: alpha/beta hydrolase [Dehalococcoidia bacterium]|nr:alpha/beta hydrolase [Dehalococcoidia bacterium]
MPYVDRPDGARIYYEVRGTGFPLLLFAPGGINSQVSFWQVSAINPFDYADEFQVIGMDQRNAEHSPAPLAAPTWAIHAADQRAVLDAVGAERTLLWGGCIGVGYLLRFIKEAPRRVAGAVGQDPVGYAEGVNNRATYFAMFEPTIALAKSEGMAAVVASAVKQPLFVRNNGAGPFASRLAADAAFREEFQKQSPAEYERLIRAYDEQMWGAEPPFISVDEAFVTSCPAPLLILPGHDVFHPTPISERICREAPKAHCLDVDCRDPEKIEATKRTIRQFLHEHAR